MTLAEEAIELDTNDWPDLQQLSETPDGIAASVAEEPSAFFERIKHRARYLTVNYRCKKQLKILAGRKQLLEVHCHTVEEQFGKVVWKAGNNTQVKEAFAACTSQNNLCETARETIVSATKALETYEKAMQEKHQPLHAALEEAQKVHAQALEADRDASGSLKEFRQRLTTAKQVAPDN